MKHHIYFFQKVYDIKFIYSFKVFIIKQNKYILKYLVTIVITKLLFFFFSLLLIYEINI